MGPTGGRRPSHGLSGGGWNRSPAAIRGQINHGPYASDPVYGDGRSGARIAAALATMPLGLEKTITY